MTMQAIQALPLEGVRILAVDDDYDSLMLLSMLLSRQGAEVETASSVDEAFEHLRQRRPHLLVSDVCMPGENGVELLGRMRSMFGDIPAIACTGQTAVMDRDLTLAAGFEAHVTKPYDPRELVRAVVNVVGR